MGSVVKRKFDNVKRALVYKEHAGASLYRVLVCRIADNRRELISYLSIYRQFSLKPRNIPFNFQKNIDIDITKQVHAYLHSIDRTFGGTFFLLDHEIDVRTFHAGEAVIACEPPWNGSNFRN